jgi:hypothetical protein
VKQEERTTKRCVSEVMGVRSLSASLKLSGNRGHSIKLICLLGIQVLITQIWRLVPSGFLVLYKGNCIPDLAEDDLAVLGAYFALDRLSMEYLPCRRSTYLCV